MATCFERAGIAVPTGGGFCVCGEFVRFDLVLQRTAHFLVCEEVDRVMSEMTSLLDIDEEAVRIGMEAAGASGQDRGTVETEPGSQETVDTVAERIEVGL